MYVCIRAIYYIILCCNIHHLWDGNLLFFLNHAAWRHRVLMVDGVDGRVFRLRIPAVSSWTFWWLDEHGSSWENDTVKRADPLNHGFWECLLEVCFPSYWREDSPCDFYNKTVSAAFQNVFFCIMQRFHSVIDPSLFSLGLSKGRVPIQFFADGNPSHERSFTYAA